MPNALRIAAALLLAAVASSALAIDRAAAEEMVRKSGLWEQLGRVEEQVRGGFAERMFRTSPRPSAAEVERIGRAIGESYAAARLRTTAVAVVAERLQDDDLAELRSWFASPTGSAIARLEATAAGDARDPRAIVVEGRALLELASPKRRELVARLMTTTNAVDALMQMTMNSALAVQRGVALADPTLPQPSAAELRATLEAQRPRMREIFAPIVEAGFASVYRSSSDEELERYVEFVGSPVGRRLNAVGVLALDAAMSAGAEEFGRRLPTARDRSTS